MPHSPSYRSVPAEGGVRTLVHVCLIIAGLLAATPAARADVDVLADCVGLSSDDEDVHACLDNYLNAMDDSIGSAVAGIRGTLRGAPLAAFERSQASFNAFRRDNCLWYLAFNAPRSEAEKIAKNCLARSSLDRLVELQRLLLTDTDTVFGTFEGHYTFDSEHNSFQPCDSERQFWVGGDDEAIASLQQQYLERTAEEGERVFVQVDGALQQTVEARSGHAGRFSLAAVRAMRAPSRGDCPVPDDSPLDTAADEVVVGEAPEADGSAAPAPALSPVADNPVADPDQVIDPAVGEGSVLAVSDADADEQRLIAYFGAWLAECEATASRSLCRLTVEFDGGDLPRLVVLRGEASPIRVSLALPAGAAATADRIRWRIDEQALGVIEGARVRQGEQGVELALMDQQFVDERLFPLLLDGYTLSVEMPGAEVARRATLVGLTRALSFADDYIGVDGD